MCGVRRTNTLLVSILQVCCYHLNAVSQATFFWYMDISCKCSCYNLRKFLIRGRKSSAVVSYFLCYPPKNTQLSVLSNLIPCFAFLIQFHKQGHIYHILKYLIKLSFNCYTNNYMNYKNRPK